MVFPEEETDSGKIGGYQLFSDAARGFKPAPSASKNMGGVCQHSLTGRTLLVLTSPQQMDQFRKSQQQILSPIIPPETAQKMG